MLYFSLNKEIIVHSHKHQPVTSGQILDHSSPRQLAGEKKSDS